MAAKKTQPTYILPPGVAAFPHIEKPDTEGKFADNKFKVRIVWSDGVDLSEIKKIINRAAKEEFGARFDEETFAYPFREWGADAEKEEFRGKITADVKSKFQPAVRDSQRNPVPTRGLKMAGDVIRVMVTLYFYAKTEKVKVGKKMVDEEILGCSLQLVAIQIIEKRAGGNNSYGDGFDAVEGGYVAGGGTGDDAEGGDDDDDVPF